MSPLVHGSDTYTGLEFAIETSYNQNVIPGGYYRIPLLGEAMFIAREAVPKNRELGALGATTTVETGRATVQGSFTVQPSYNARWFNRLLVQAFAAEDSQQGFLPSARTAPNYGGNNPFATHGYIPQTFKEKAAGSASGVASGIRFMVNKSGATSGGYREFFGGCIIKRMTWEHPEGDVPRVTFDIIGQSTWTGTAATVSTVDAVEHEGGTGYANPLNIRVGARDLKNRITSERCPGLLRCGAALAATPNLVGWKFVLESNIEFAPGFLNSPDVIDKPGHVGNWSVTGEITSRLQRNEFAASMPATDYLAGTASKLRLRYCSDVNRGTATIDANAAPYAMDFYFPSIVWTKADNSIKDAGGETTVYGFEASEGTILGTVADHADPATDAYAYIGLSPGSQKGLMVLQTVGNDNRYTTTGEGSNKGGTLPYSTATSRATVAAGDWANDTEVFVEDQVNATSANQGDELILSGFDFTEVPSGSTINGVTVRLICNTDDITDDKTLEVSMSWNAGSNYTTAVETSVLTKEPKMLVLGHDTDDWGHTPWDDTELEDLWVKIVSTGTQTSGTWEIDYVDVTVAYDVP